MGSRLPALGPRGEGWVAAQVLLFVAIGGAGLQDLLAHGPDREWGNAQLAVGAAAIAVGGLVAGRGLWDLRAGLSPFPRPIAGAPLIDSGAYRLVRHPIYSGLVLGAIGWGIVAASSLTVALAGLLFLLLAAKSRREEVWLSEVHPGYKAYQARTKRLIPWIY